MGSSWFDKVANLLGYDDQDDKLEDFEDEREVEPRGRKKAPIFSIHTSSDVKIIIMTPEGFNEAEKGANYLKNRKLLVVNFSRVTKEIAQRFLDFLGGTVFSLEGSMQRVSEDVFLFVPSNATICSDSSEEISQESYITELDREDTNGF